MRLENEKIVLKKIEDADIQDLTDISFYDGEKAATAGQALEMLHKINANYSEGDSIHWGIADKLSGKLVGTCGYYRGFEKAAGELGCILLPEYKGYGYMSAALQLAVNFGLKQMGLTHIWAATSAENTKAMQLLERLGFVKITESPDGELEYQLSATLPQDHP